MARLLFTLVLAMAVSLSFAGSVRAADVDLAPLGDLTAFKTPADAALKAATDSDLKTAKDKMKDVETAWDAAEAALKPKSDAAWTFVDKKIDAALHAVRAAKPDAAKCKDSIQALVTVLTPAKK